MPDYVSVGVKDLDGNRIQTRKEFIRLCRKPASLVFDTTHGLDLIFGNKIPDDIILVVAGPDPYNCRQWRACVMKSSKGSGLLIN